MKTAIVPKNNYKELRRKFARWVSNLPIPGVVRLTRWLMLKEDVDSMQVHVKAIIENNRIAANHAARAINMFPEMAAWFCDEKYELLQGGILIATDAVNAFAECVGMVRISVIFKQLVPNDDAYVALMHFMALIPMYAEKYGYPMDEAGEGHIADNMEDEALKQLLVNQLADNLMKAVPGYWKFESLAAEIHEVFDW